MASGFKAGNKAIGSGVTEVSVTGLSLGFTPTAVTVSVRQPADGGDAIGAWVVGTPTASGFTALLSAPTPSAGYSLDYVAFGEGIEPTPGAGDTLQVTYAELKTELAKFLGYDADNLTTEQASEIDGYIQSGMRQFYYPPSVNENGLTHEWSFLKLDGSVDTTAGTASYVLPDGFGRVMGQLIYGDNEARLTVPVIPYGEMLAMMKRGAAEQTRPRFAAITAISEIGTKGQKKKLYLYPTPDKAYTLNFQGDADTGKLDATDRPIPLGGPMYSELIIESCLAIAEQKANDEQGLHTSKFTSLLAGFISRDNKSGAQEYGYVGDPEGWRW